MSSTLADVTKMTAELVKENTDNEMNAKQGEEESEDKAEGKMGSDEKEETTYSEEVY